MPAYNTIAFRADRCNGCGNCMNACARASTASGTTRRARLEVLADDTGRFELAMCRQCADPDCVQSCPAAALSKNTGSGVIDWDQDKCVNCLLCTAGCSYAGIVLDETVGHVVKCDHCGGDPACVRACTTGALEYLTAARIYNEVGSLEDLFVPGLTGCQGCSSELLMRHTLRRCGPNTVLATPPGCVPGMGAVGFNGLAGCKVPVFPPLLTNTAAMLAGVKRFYKRKGREVTALALAGDGGAADVGFQSLSGAAERGEQMLFLVIDNEGYMNTGMQRSSCTPYGAWTTTTPVGRESRGKSQDAKNLPLLMVAHRCAYVATASTAFMADFYEKLDRALEVCKRGFAYLHVYSPCTTGWRFPSQKTVEVARKAVESNFVLLWEYTPQAGLRLTHPIDHPMPVRRYLEAVGKYRHLSAEQIAHIERHIADDVAVIARQAASAPGGSGRVRREEESLEHGQTPAAT